MQIRQQRWTEEEGWADFGRDFAQADLVLVFADTPYFTTPGCFHDLRERFPLARLLGCSSSGNVNGVRISDGDAVATAVRFAGSWVRLAFAPPGPGQNIGQRIRELVDGLRGDGLRHVLVLADGHGTNGSEIASGLVDCGLPVTGGMAGDGPRFGTTWVMADAPAQAGGVAVLGFYGDVTVRHGCYAGWRDFGAQRRVTHSVGNIVHTIDGKPALDLYQKYLGQLAAGLPGTGLRFPLSVRLSAGGEPVIRTLLGIDEAERSLRFAGDVPQGCICQLMRTRLEDLIDSAGQAAMAAAPEVAGAAGLGLLVSCLGRRLVLGQHTEDELEAVQQQLGPATVLAGLYSHGELATCGTPAQCQLHNQTMTLTTLYE